MRTLKNASKPRRVENGYLTRKVSWTAPTFSAASTARTASEWAPAASPDGSLTLKSSVGSSKMPSLGANGCQSPPSIE